MDETAEDVGAVRKKDVSSDLDMQEHFKKIDIESEIFDSWKKIGTAEGFITDTQIASYLIQQYENGQGRGVTPNACCNHCHAPLTLVCMRCQLLHQQTENSQDQAECFRKIMKYHQAPNSESEVKVEPFNKDSPSDDQHVCSDSDDKALCHLSDNQAQGSPAKKIQTTTDMEVRHRDILGNLTKTRKQRNSQVINAVTASEKHDQDYSLPLTFKSDFLCSVSENVESVHKRSKAKVKLRKKVTTKLPYSCAHCTATFKLKYKLENHIRTHAGEKPHACSTCLASFKWKHSLQEHMRRVHGVDKLFLCKICDKRFSSRSGLRHHKQTHENLKNAKSHKCSECDAAFGNACHLRLHVRIHTGEKPFDCTVCSSCFTTKDKLKVHMRRHTGERPYICEECGATFRESTVLKTHMRTHTGEKPYICKDCGVAFAQSSALRTHVRIHTGEKPHMCTVCGAAFPSSSRLDRHMRVHTGDRPYVCSECGSGFKSSGELTNHNRIHTKYKPAVCKECGASFSRPGNLKSHMRTHTGEKPYVCEVCSKAFTQQGGLKMHMLMHTGEKPCVCDICGATYRKAQTLRLHKEKKHSTCVQNQTDTDTYIVI